MNDKGAFRLISIASVLIFAAVLILNRKILPAPQSIPSFIHFLPTLNAFINGTCSILLILSLVAIKKKNIELHKKINLTAFFLSSIFLVSYVTVHYFLPDTKYGDLDHNGIVDASELGQVSSSRGIYLIILLSHILLATIVLPLVLLSFYFGLKDNRARHRKIVRYSYPIWLYVTITGVIVYLMISPYYPFN